MIFYRRHIILHFLLLALMARLLMWLILQNFFPGVPEFYGGRVCPLFRPQNQNHRLLIVAIGLGTAFMVRSFPFNHFCWTGNISARATRTQYGVV
jgi:hypothetical protein